ncbi:cholesterol side-chain cleavage enzyme, mitochondrial-like [Rhipicephalus sanguineus]|uniref:cholesterol side-chain cleavage enzyme, mitochondrial-like n=1 Tax=Rhipicephalus sanguineus TaxID=34632 RepID=UPI0018939BC0|nr:cholesterol side-chain cleavage enzyme, mitochondrial-like [Rhipicephalus sanguineus]
MFVEAHVASHIEENFGSPELFIPERWLKSNKDIWHHESYASLPFSYGPRMCLGRRMAELQICLFMVKVLLRYELHYDKEDVDIHGRLVYEPKTPVDIVFKKLPAPLGAKAPVL